MIALAYLFASIVGILCGAFSMLWALPLAPTWRRFKTIYSYGMGLLALLAGWISVFIASTILRRLDFTPGAGLFLLVGAGWLQNDVRKALRARDELVAWTEWKMLVGHSAGVLIGAIWRG